MKIVLFFTRIIDAILFTIGSLTRSFFWFGAGLFLCVFAARLFFYGSAG